MSVRRVELHEYKKVAEVLYDAFGSDLLLSYWGKKDNISPEEAERVAKLQFEYVSWAFIKDGYGYTVGDFDGVALWLGPEQDISFWTILRSGLWRLRLLFGPNARRIYFQEFIPYLHRCKKSVLGDDDNDSWYLTMLATRSTSRGKGYSRLLIEEVTKQADWTGKKCYLESSSLKNCDIYVRFGFKRAMDLELPESDPSRTFYAMVRDPVTVQHPAGPAQDES